MDTDFLWRAEMACRAAWPAEAETEIGGWVARRSGGSIRRVNSLNQLPGFRPIDDAILDRVEAHYARFEQPALVRLMSFTGNPGEEVLSRRGYQVNGNTTTLRAELDPSRHKLRAGVCVWEHPSPEWLAARNRIAISDTSVFSSMLQLIEGPANFAGAEVDGIIQSIAYGAIVDGLLVVESVATAQAHRGAGHARRVVETLMGWAAALGVGEAVLQVVTDNTPARALYRSLGFTTELFEYFYMRQSER